MTIPLSFPAGNQQQTTINNLNSRASKRRYFQVSYSWNQLENLDENKTLGGKKWLKQKFCKIRRKNPTSLLNFLMAPKENSSFLCYSPLYHHSSLSPSYRSQAIKFSAMYSVWKPRLSTFIIWSFTIKCSRALHKFLNLPILVNTIYEAYIPLMYYIYTKWL